jgi:hypothetical protein
MVRVNFAVDQPSELIKVTPDTCFAASAFCVYEFNTRLSQTALLCCRRQKFRRCIFRIRDSMMLQKQLNHGTLPEFKIGIKAQNNEYSKL